VEYCTQKYIDQIKKDHTEKEEKTADTTREEVGEKRQKRLREQEEEEEKDRKREYRVRAIYWHEEGISGEKTTWILPVDKLRSRSDRKKVHPSLTFILALVPDEDGNLSDQDGKLFDRSSLPYHGYKKLQEGSQKLIYYAPDNVQDDEHEDLTFNVLMKELCGPPVEDDLPIIAVATGQ
jgi:hypothetical protein